MSGILAHQPGNKPVPSALEGKVLTIGLTRDSLSKVSTAATAAKSLQLCPILCDPIDSSPPGSSVPGILKAGTREWVAIFFSNA